MMTAREHQLDALRTAAKELRELVKKSREEAASWQEKADRARELADRNEESARVWELLADALDHGQLDDIVVPLGTGPEEPTNARIHALQGRLMTQLSEYGLDAWSIHCRELRAMLHRVHGGSRRAILAIADRLGIDYTETARTDGQVNVAAKGEIDGIEVEIWSLLPADQAPADDDGALNDKGRDYAEEAAQRDEAKREGNAELLDEQAADVAGAYLDAIDEERYAQRDEYVNAPDPDTEALAAADAERWHEANAATLYNDRDRDQDDDPYGGLTNADVLSADELYGDEKADEIALDVADEERWAAEAANDYVDGDEHDYEDGEDQDDDEDGDL